MDPVTLATIRVLLAALRLGQEAVCTPGGRKFASAQIRAECARRTRRWWITRGFRWAAVPVAELAWGWACRNPSMVEAGLDVLCGSSAKRAVAVSEEDIRAYLARQGEDGRPGEDKEPADAEADDSDIAVRKVIRGREVRVYRSVAPRAAAPRAVAGLAFHGFFR